MTGARISPQFVPKNRDKSLFAGFKVILQIKGNQAALHRFLKLFLEPA